MKRKIKFLLPFIIVLSAMKSFGFPVDNTNHVNAKILFDQKRSRNIPVLMYSAKQSINLPNQKPLVVINHGYTVKNSEYSFIANDLLRHGYLVVSIQHDLKNDPKLPITGNLHDRRMPLWVRGVENIQFTLGELKKRYPFINTTKIILIGHSNGGDISMLFAEKFPSKVYKIISLDSLRMPFPNNKNIKVLTFRANDTKADTGVLPNLENQKKFRTKIMVLENAKHIDLCDRGPVSVKRKIEEAIAYFLRNE